MHYMLFCIMPYVFDFQEYGMFSQGLKGMPVFFIHDTISLADDNEGISGEWARWGWPPDFLGDRGAVGILCVLILACYDYLSGHQ